MAFIHHKSDAEVQELAAHISEEDLNTRYAAAEVEADFMRRVLDHWRTHHRHQNPTQRNEENFG